MLYSLAHAARLLQGRLMIALIPPVCSKEDFFFFIIRRFILLITINDRFALLFIIRPRNLSLKDDTNLEKGIILHCIAVTFKDVQGLYQ